ncbi:MAG TPA: DUF2752 domain-containing protein [Nocardioides sp.]|nr:DUF2752 domain-containing protein [Nocardioides sp.]
MTTHVDTRRPTPRFAESQLLAAGGVAALGVACLLSPEGIEDGPVVCPFRLATGLPCPGCGMTRSWVYTTHGWWREAFTAHPFGPVAIAAVLGLAVLVVRARVRGTAAPRIRLRNPVVLTLVGAWLTFAAVRLVLAV